MDYRREYLSQAGVALLTVLFILVLLSTLMFYMVEDEHVAIRRVSNQRDLEQGYQMVVGSEKWAMKVLQRDLQESETDHLNESWNNLLPEVNLEQGTLSARVIDQQGLFNINNPATMPIIAKGTQDHITNGFFNALKRKTVIKNITR